MRRRTGSPAALRIDRLFVAEATGAELNERIRVRRPRGAGGHERVGLRGDGARFRGRGPGSVGFEADLVALDRALDLQVVREGRAQLAQSSPLALSGRSGRERRAGGDRVVPDFLKTAEVEDAVLDNRPAYLCVGAPLLEDRRVGEALLQRRAQ